MEWRDLRTLLWTLLDRWLFPLFSRLLICIRFSTSKVRRFWDLVHVSWKIRKLFGPENSCVPLSFVGIYCAGVANCIYRRSPQLPSNKTKSRPMTMALSHVYSLHAYMFIYRLWTNVHDQFVMQRRDISKTTTPDLTSGWKSSPGEIYHRNSAWA